jgi:hypothetical protein
MTIMKVIPFHKSNFRIAWRSMSSVLEEKFVAYFWEVLFL